MAEFVRRAGATATAIDYRLVSPLFDHQGLVVNGSLREVSVRDHGGRITATGRVQCTVKEQR